MPEISPQAVQLVRSTIPATQDEELSTLICDDRSSAGSSTHPSVVVLLAEIVVRLDRIEKLLEGAAEEPDLGLPE